MEVKATLETRHSTKSDKDYKVIIIKLTDNYEKKVFLEPAELELLKVTENKKNGFLGK